MAEGGYVELEQFDNDEERRGTALWQMDHIIEKKKKEGLWLQVRLVAATDEHLQWWLKRGPGKDYRRNFVVYLCSTKRHRKQEFHSDTFRDITSGDIMACKVSSVKEEIDGEIAILVGIEPLFDPTYGAAAGKLGHLDWEVDIGPDALTNLDIPARLAALRKIVALRQKRLKLKRIGRKRRGLNRSLKLLIKKRRPKNT